MDGYMIDAGFLFVFAIIPPLLLKRFIKKYTVWRVLVGPSALVGMMIGYYLFIK